MRHVDLRPQRPRAVGKLAGPHPLEKIEVLLDGPRAVRAGPARLGEGAAMVADLLGREIADVRLAGADQLERPRVELIEIVGGVELAVLPIEPQPVDVFLDRVDVLLVLFARIGVVEAEIALAAELLGDAEVQANALGVPDVQIAVGLRGEARLDPAAVFAGAIVFENDLANEVDRRCGFFSAHGSQLRFVVIRDELS